MAVTAPQQTQTPTGASRIIQMVMSYRASKILLVAVDLDLFTWIHNGTQTQASLCKVLSIHPRPTEVLLDSLVALGFLIKNGSRYKNTPLSDEFLVKGAPHYLGNNLKYQELMWKPWSDLGGVVRRGYTRYPLEKWLLSHKTFSQEYIQGMHNIAQKPAHEIANLFASGGARRMLDVGGGPATYALAFLERHPSLQADVLDLPSTIKVARKLVKSHRLGKRVRFVPGNYHQYSFGVKRFDFILMSHITHDEGEKENKKLIRKALHALRPGGHLIIHDFMTQSDHTAPLFSALFSVHMLVYTKKGRVYSDAEYSSWLQEEGFRKVRKYDIAKESPNASIALIATR